MPFKFAYRFFAFLDIISILLLTSQIYQINYSQIPVEINSRLHILLNLVMYVLLFGSAAGLWMLKKWGAIVYYIQFPVRLIVWVFSFGFLTMLGELASIDIFDWLFRIIMILEFMRLYFTVKLHREYFV